MDIERKRARERKYRAGRYLRDAGFRAKIAAYAKSYRESHPEHLKRMAEKAVLKRHNLRKAVIAVLGGRCTCCGEATPEFLAVDHVHNNGADHRKQMARETLLRWLKANGPHPDFQLLCHNCNMAKSWGLCPHKR